MTKAELSNLVNEGFRLDQEIKDRQTRLEEIKETITAAAGGNVQEFPGEGCKATVNYSARVFSKVPIDDLPKCKKMAGEYFEKLFCSAPIDKFGDVAKALLGEKAEALIKLLTGVPSPRVGFKKV